MITGKESIFSSENECRPKLFSSFSPLKGRSLMVKVALGGFNGN